RTYALVLTKGARDRAGEEAVLHAVLLHALAEAAGVAERLTTPLLSGEKLDASAETPADPVLQLLGGTIARLCVESDGRMRKAAPTPPVLVPGAFNPAHGGHRRLADAATRLTGQPAAFELSVHNVDKPPL